MEPIRYKDLLINFTNTFSSHWNSRMGGLDEEGAAPVKLYRPNIPEGLAGYSILGDVLEPGFDDIQNLKFVPVVADAEGPSGTALMPPVDFDWVWELNAREVEDRVSIWRPIPPPGYVSMGLVSSTSLSAPDKNVVKCVRQDLVIQAEVNRKVWSVECPPAALNFSAWSIAPPTPLPAEVFFCAETFVGQGPHIGPTPVSCSYALRVHLPVQPPSVPSHAPVLTGYARPSAFNRSNAIYTTRLPWFVVTDPVLTPQQQFFQSPQYFLKRTENYELVRHAHNNTGQVQRYNWAIQSGESTTRTQTRSTTAGLEISTEVSLTGFLKTSVKGSLSISQSNALTQGWQTSKTFTVWSTVGAYKAVAVFLISYTYRLVRTDGSQVGEGFTCHPDNSLYWTEFPPTPNSVTKVEPAEEESDRLLHQE